MGSLLLRYRYQDGSLQAALPMRVVSDDGERVVAWLAPGTEIMYWALPGGGDPRSLPLDVRFTAQLTTAPFALEEVHCSKPQAAASHQRDRRGWRRRRDATMG